MTPKLPLTVNVIDLDGDDYDADALMRAQQLQQVY